MVFIVPSAGFEPATLAGQRPKRCVYANSTTRAKEGKKFYLSFFFNDFTFLKIKINLKTNEVDFYQFLSFQPKPSLKISKPEQALEWLLLKEREPILPLPTLYCLYPCLLFLQTHLQLL